MGWGEIHENIAQESRVFWSRFDLGVTITRSISFVNGFGVWFLVFWTRQLFTDSILIIRVGNPCLGDALLDCLWHLPEDVSRNVHMYKALVSVRTYACPTYRKPGRRPQEALLNNDHIWSQLCTIFSQHDTVFMLDWTIQYSTRPGYIWMNLPSLNDDVLVYRISSYRVTRKLRTLM